MLARRRGFSFKSLAPLFQKIIFAYAEVDKVPRKRLVFVVQSRVIGYVYPFFFNGFVPLVYIEFFRPLIVGGGPAAANPEPIIDFFDIFFIGEGEYIDAELCKIVEKYKGDKNKILEEAAKIDGIYVPSVCKTIDGINVTTVKKAVVKNLDKAPYPTKPLVPNIEIIHDRSVMELYRGCYAGCRFCQACFFYRPVRYREKDTVASLAAQIIDNTGFDEMGLASLSSGDYEDICELIKELKELTEKKNVVLQMPSLRLDSFTEGVLERAKKTSLTFAPEAGTQRLRNVINKNVTEEDIVNSMRIAFTEIGRAHV